MHWSREVGRLFSLRGFFNAPADDRSDGGKWVGEWQMPLKREIVAARPGEVLLDVVSVMPIRTGTPYPRVMHDEPECAGG